jgi:hypothetical protein
MCAPSLDGRSKKFGSSEGEVAGNVATHQAAARIWGAGKAARMGGCQKGVERMEWGRGGNRYDEGRSEIMWQLL